MIVRTIRRSANWAARHRVGRRVLLHTSAVGFSLDFVHAIFRKAMIGSEFYERYLREDLTTYSAVAATVIIYLDGRAERRRLEEEHKHLRDEIRALRESKEHDNA